MHSYSLYYPVNAECLCCHLSYRTEFKSQTDQVICPRCARHLGMSAHELQRRIGDHIEQAREAQESQRDTYERRLTLMREQCDVYRQERDRLSAETDALKQTITDGIAATPPESVQRWWETDAIREAHVHRDAAYRSRDHAYRALWHADRLHHHDRQRDEKCSCGNLAADCKELKAIEDAGEALDRWEKNQIERFKKGQEHGLPSDHPLVLAGPGSDLWRRYEYTH